MTVRTLALLCLICATGCNQSSTNEAVQEKPAKLEPHPSEADLYRIVLTPKAEERLQISTVPARLAAVPRSRSLGGELVIPDGKRIPVTAPLTGTLSRINGVTMPTAGQAIEFNQPLLQLLAILRPDLEVPGAAERVQMANARASLVSAQIQSEGDFQQAAAQVEATEIALARARKLLMDRAGSQRAVDDAVAALNIASKGLEAAEQRKTLLATLTLEADSGEAPVVTIRAPSDGIIQTVSARAGQVVSAGAPLFEIVDLNQLWVRVPVYAGQVQEVDLNRPAALVSLADQSSQVTVQPVAAPPTADPLAASIDLYYAVDNSAGLFHPGERVSVNIPLKGEAESLVVPRASILRDIHGTAWVYTKFAEREFVRARVAVQFSTSELSVLSLGPEVGTEIVVDGAAELFGTEFGAGK